MAEGWTPAFDRLFDPDHELAGDGACRRWAWLDLCHMANYEDGTRMIGATPIALRRGEFLASIRFLANRWQWSKNRVSRYLAALTSLQKISPGARTGFGTVYRVVSYDTYRDVRDTKRDTKRDNGGTATGQRKQDVHVEHKRGSPNYVGRAVDIWREHQGEPTVGKLGAALKPLTKRHDADTVLRHFAIFAQSTDARFGFHYFAEHFNDFDPNAPAFPGLT